MKNNRYTKEKIYDLLPAIYKIRDKEEGEPLKALLEIIGEQVEFIEDDIEKLYNNWFIETCDEWLVPYIGDLLQARILNPVTKVTSSHRSWVANTISYRRKKGTLAALEQLSRDVTGWNCHAVEFMENIVTAQYLNHLRLEHTATVNLRNKDTLELMDTPFDISTHTLDVRNIDSKRGYYNIPNIGIFLWRLQAYPVINAPAFSIGEGKYTFSQLGYDLPIYNLAERETSINQIASELNVPLRIRRTLLKKYVEIYRISKRNFAYKNSIKIVKSVLVQNENSEVIETQVSPEDIIVCNLSNWDHRPFTSLPSGKVAIDPELGRIVFPDSEQKIVDVHVSYYYGFSGEIGGGFYERTESEIELSLAKEKEEQENFYHYKISKKHVESSFDTLFEALKKWKTEEYYNSKDVIFEIIDSEIYTDVDTDGHNINPIEIEIPENVTVVIKSQKLQRPVFRLYNPITIRGKSESRIIFDGIFFTLAVNSSELHDDQLYDNNNILLKILKGDLLELDINHCTFVPARTEQENINRLLFSWENIPTIQNDVEILKKFLFDIFNEKWIKSNNVVINKEGPDNNIINVSSSDTEVAVIPPIILELNSSLGTISIKKRYIGVDGQHEDDILYKLPVMKGSNNLMNIYSSTYSIGIFGDSIQNNNNNDNNGSLKVSINRSIVGRIDLSACNASLKIVDSIVDGKGVIDALRCTSANIENVTVFGKASFIILDFASNSIFTDIIDIDRRQQGCVRFCYILHGSKIPRPYRCILEYESNININNITDGGSSSPTIPTNMKKEILLRQTMLNFSSTKYGDDGYGQLHANVDKKIFEGGDNGSELGAFNHLYNSQRIRNLLLALDEYLKFGLKAGIFLVT
jgi:hypothetical protein